MSSDLILTNQATLLLDIGMSSELILTNQATLLSDTGMTSDLINVGFPCSSCTDSCSLLSPQLCYAQCSFAYRCAQAILCVGSVQKRLPKIWPALCTNS